MQVLFCNHQNNVFSSSITSSYAMTLIFFFFNSMKKQFIRFVFGQNKKILPCTLWGFRRSRGDFRLSDRNSITRCFYIFLISRRLSDVNRLVFSWNWALEHYEVSTWKLVSQKNSIYPKIIKKISRNFRNLCFSLNFHQFRKSKGFILYSPWDFWFFDTH